MKVAKPVKTSKPVALAEIKPIPAESKPILDFTKVVSEPIEVVRIPRPTFENLISQQTTVGSWAGSQGAAFSAFFKDGNIEDAGVRQGLDGLSGEIKNEVDIETLYVTLLAILVLTEFFVGREDEWTLLVSKAKAFLKSSGVAKPEKLMQKFSLQ